MRTLQYLSLAFALVGCAETQRKSDAQVLAGWTGPPPHVKIELVGQSATDDSQRRCDQEIARLGAVADPNAPVQAILLLQDQHNVMQVVSKALGTVRNEPIPGSTVEELCSTAVRAVAGALHDEADQRASVMPPPGSHPPGFATVNPDTINAPGTDPAGRASAGTQSGPIAMPR